MYIFFLFGQVVKQLMLSVSPCTHQCITSRATSTSNVTYIMWCGFAKEYKTQGK